MRALPTSTSAASDNHSRRRGTRYDLLSLSIGCLALICSSWGSLAPTAEIGAAGSPEQSKPRGEERDRSGLDSTSIDLLKRAAHRQRDENASGFLVGTSESAGPAAEHQGGRP